MRIPVLTVLLLASLGLGLGCAKLKLESQRAEYPKFYVKHETVEFPLKNLNRHVNRSDVIPPIFIVMSNGHKAIYFGIVYGITAKYHLAYDCDAKSWLMLASYEAPVHLAINNPTVEQRAEREKAFALAKLKFDEDFAKFVQPLLASAKQSFHGFSDRWVVPGLNEWEREHPRQAALFAYSQTGGYETYKERGGGGALGLEPTHVATHSYFVGIKSTFYRSKLLFESVDETMGDLTTVSGDFHSLLYEHRTVDSIKFTLIDLAEIDTEIDTAEAAAHVPPTPAQSANPR